jgi:N4-gp56 family major capsid protein
MADFTTTITDAGVIDADELTIYHQQVILAAFPELVVDQAVSVQEVGIVGKTAQFAKYATLSVPSALSDGVDPASAALADSVATITPAEEGQAITLARLADLESGLKAGNAASILVGQNAGATADARAVTALSGATTNIIYPNAVTAEANLGLNDLLDGVFSGRLYNKLRRTNVPGINGQAYLGFANDDCLHDLREDTANGGWTDVSKYADPQSVLRNEVGMYKGIRWMTTSNISAEDGGGSGDVDSYEVYVVGFNALGYASSHPIELMVTGPFDKLRRFVNFGWYGIFAYGLVREENMVIGRVASTVGVNAA